MQWFREEDSRLVKAWEACASLKKAADKTYAASPNGAYIVATSMGVIGRTAGYSVIVNEFAQVVSDLIKQHGWKNLGFDEAADVLQAYVRNFLRGREEHFKEMEIILLQNRESVLDDMQCFKKKPVLVPA